MKKNILFLLFTIVSLSSVLAQEQYTINGTAPSQFNGEYVYLSKVDISNPMNTPIHIDSAYIDDGRFVFKVVSPGDTTLYSIVHNNVGGMFALDSEGLSATYVEGNPMNYFQIRGSKLNNDFAYIMEYNYKSIEKELTIAKKRKEALAKNEWKLEDEEAIRENDNKLMLDYFDNVTQFVKGNISNPAGQYIYILFNAVFNKVKKEEIEAKLSDNDRQKISAAKESIQAMMTTLKKEQPDESQIKIGDQYIDFEGEMLSGEKTKLSEAISSKKLILLDFWASWCMPCIKEMPEIVDLHNRYKDKGLQIIGISLDKNRSKWSGAVENIGMPWIQFIDSNLASPIAEIYGAHSIPHTVLIDEYGKVVATKLRGKTLHDKIAELLSE